VRRPANAAALSMDHARHQRYQIGTTLELQPVRSQGDASSYTFIYATSFQPISRRSDARYRTIGAGLCLQDSRAPQAPEELLDIGQDGLLIPREGPMVGAVELDKARLREVAREVAPGSDANGAIPAAMEHQARD